MNCITCSTIFTLFYHLGFKQIIRIDLINPDILQQQQLQLFFSWLTIWDIIQEQRLQSKLWADWTGVCCKSVKQVAHQFFFFPASTRHRWKWHHKALSTWIPTSYRCSDLVVNFSVSLENRRPHENGKMFEIPPLDFLYAIWEEEIFFSSPLSINTPQTSPFIWSFKIQKVWLDDYFYTYCLWPPVT